MKKAQRKSTHVTMFNTKEASMHNKHERKVKEIMHANHVQQKHYESMHKNTNKCLRKPCTIVKRSKKSVHATMFNNENIEEVRMCKKHTKESSTRAYMQKNKNHVQLKH
jgi:hypothetical protein